MALESEQPLIVLRTHKFDAVVRDFAAELAEVPAHELVCLIDERRGPVDVRPFPHVAVTDDAIEQLGLHRPAGYAWRCGDYGLYLAQRKWPNHRYIWLIEYDVRVGLRSLTDFFQNFVGLDHDLIAAMYHERGYEWHWYPSMARRKQPVFGCMFPILRISTRALSACLAERRRMSRSIIYRSFWPNDEAILASYLSREGFDCVDFNQLGSYYSSDTLTFEKPFRLDDFDSAGAEPMLYHPVLDEADYEKKLGRLSKPAPRFEKIQRRVRYGLRYIVP